MKNTILYPLTICCIMIGMQYSAFAGAKHKPTNDPSKKRKAISLASSDAKRFTEKYAKNKKH